MIEKWKAVWRDAIAPQLSTAGLRALREALLTDNLRLLQGSTTQPLPLTSFRDFEVEGACAIGYCGWIGDGLRLVSDVEEYFAKVCHETDVALDEPAGCRWFLNWADQTPRDEMRRKLLSEVESVLAARQD